VFEPGSPFEVAGARLTAFPVPHGDVTAFGFRVGPLGYVTDAKRLTEQAKEILDGVSVLVINALWHGNPHPTHFNIEEAVAAVREVGPERAYLTHLTHRVRHAELAKALPDGIEPAWDSLVVSIDDN
jgi:phosphoribosyl 1,2-cyclic phosphate phosphodiesterase